MTRGIRIEKWPFTNAQNPPTTPVAESLVNIVCSGCVYGGSVIPNSDIKLILPPESAVIVMLCDNHVIQRTENHSGLGF